MLEQAVAPLAWRRPLKQGLISFFLVLRVLSSVAPPSFVMGCVYTVVIIKNIPVDTYKWLI